MSKIFKRLIGFIAFLLGLALVIGIGSVAVFMRLNSPPDLPPVPERHGLAVVYDEEKTSVVFEVRRGESAASVGRRLADAGIIRSRELWNLICRFRTKYYDEQIKTGSFFIEVPDNQLSIHKALVSGRQILLRVTVPEGFTLKRIAALMEASNICPADDFLAAATDSEITARYKIPGATMEGYLFPDTYFFPPSYPAQRVVRAMADNFFTRIAEINKSLTVMSPEELNKLVILASIVEREYRMPSEAPIMAGVFANRIKINMALQSCATVEYIITEIQGREHPKVLTGVDIAIQNIYNTYIHPGLPPGPICIPGKVSLAAAFSPQESNFLYFRLINEYTGQHHFSRTHDEHIRAGRLFVKGRP